MVARCGWWWVALAVFGAVSGCSPKSQSALPKQGGALGIAAISGPMAKGGPLQVSYFAPRGETEAEVEISVSFDRPMVALGAQASVAEGLLAIEPGLAGNARWVGSQTLLFQPSAAVPMATEFRVAQARELKALDGQALVEPLSFAFATPAPSVVRTAPSEGSRGEERKQPLDLYFNQRVSLEQVAAQAQLSVRVGEAEAKPHEFAVERPDPEDERRVRLVPKQLYPLGAEVVMRLRAGLRGSEGPRALVQDFVTRFEVYGALRIVAQPLCRGVDCDPRLVFSNPVNIGRAAKLLQFEPKLTTPLSHASANYESSTLYLGGEGLTPDTEYRVRVEGPLRDVYGNALEGERVATLRTPPLPPSARLLLDGEIVPRSAPGRLRVRVQNVKKARLELVRLRAEDVLPLDVQIMRPGGQPSSHDLGAASGTERRIALVDAEPLRADGRGAFLATVIATSASGELREQRLVTFTDLAPSLKVSEQGGVVWVTRLSDAQPVAGARVRILRGIDPVAAGKSDSAGLFRFTLPREPSKVDDEYEHEDLAVVVEKEGDISFARKYQGIGPWQLSDNASSSAQGPVAAHLFTERGIYRPGDTLQLKGILRSTSERGLVPTRGDVTVRVFDASERELERATLALSPFGTFVRAIRIPGSVPLGPLALRVEHQGRRFSTSADVAEFQPVELEASLKSARERYVRGETASLALSGRFLFGAPAREANVYWSARGSARPFAEQRFAGFTFHDQGVWAWREEDSFQIGGQLQLDAAGAGTLSVPLDQTSVAGPSWLEVEATVAAQGAEVATRTLVALTPAEVVVGLRPATTLGESGKPLAIELVASSPEGEAQAGVALEAQLLERVYETKLIEGRPVREQRDQLVGSCKKRSQRAAVRCSFTPQKAGLHVARVRAKDRAGRESLAALPLYVYGPGVASWGDGDEPVLELKAERSAYALGERAKILVPSPFVEAEALITVERDGVLSVERQRVGSASTIDLHIDERFVPNAFVSVLLLRPHTSADDGLDYRVGSIELAADMKQRKLSVSVQPDAPDKRPGEEVVVKLAVQDGAGKATAAELTVFAVDEGVLALTGYRTPDPFATLYAARPLSVWTSDARANLARTTAEADDSEDEKGGDEGGGGGQMLRSNFAAVALFVPNVESDAHGQAEVRFKLPDATTRYRIMAVAASRGAEVGAGEGFVRTHKPLMLRPLLPRVLRADDALSAGVSVHNESEVALDVELELALSGLELGEAAKKSVRVAAGSAVEVRYATRARRAGEARFTFVATAGAERDALQITRPVLAPSPVETVSVAGTSAALALREMLAPLPGVRSDVGGLELTLATSVLSELEAPARALLAYEYGCSEQLASRLVGLSALERLRKPLGLRDGSFAPQAASLLSELERHQRSDGSFGLWRADDHPPGPLSAFLTAYALLAFRELERAGIATSGQASARAKEFLAAYLRSDGSRSGLQGADRAFVVYALARVGVYDAGYAAKLFEQRGELPIFARVELAHALSHDKAGRARVETLLHELSNAIRLTADEAHVESNVSDAHAPLLVSDVRATAELALLLLDHDPSHVLLPKLARWLGAARERDGSWASTQESAWGLMALAGYFERKEQAQRPQRAAVQLGERELGKVELAGARARASFQVPMAELPQQGAVIAIDKQTRGDLHYMMRLRYARTALPSSASERGFFVERSYERFEPGALVRGERVGEAGLHAKLGDYVRVTLRIAVPAARRFVLIADPLPAGLEPVDLDLTTEASSLSSLLRARAPYDHYELRDDRAVFAVDDLPPGLYTYSYLTRASSTGSFVAPPTKVEEMYHPETQGLTAASRFEVAP